MSSLTFWGVIAASNPMFDGRTHLNSRLTKCQVSNSGPQASDVRSFCHGPPGGAFWEPIDVQRVGPHLGAVARARGRKVMPVLDTRGINEVLVQVVDVLAHAVFKGCAHSDVIEDREVLDVFAQANPTGVRADRNAEL